MAPFQPFERYEPYSVTIAGKRFRSDNIKDIKTQCVMFSEKAFGPSDPVQAVRNLMEAGKAAAPFMSRDEIGRMLEVLGEKMMARAK